MWSVVILYGFHDFYWLIHLQNPDIKSTDVFWEKKKTILIFWGEYKTNT